MNNPDSNMGGCLLFNGWKKPQTINTDKAPIYAAAIKILKEEGICPPEIGHRQVKYLNNIVE